MKSDLIDKKSKLNCYIFVNSKEKCRFDNNYLLNLLTVFLRIGKKFSEIDFFSMSEISQWTLIQNFRKTIEFWY